MLVSECTTRFLTFLFASFHLVLLSLCCLLATPTLVGWRLLGSASLGHKQTHTGIQKESRYVITWFHTTTCSNQIRNAAFARSEIAGEGGVYMMGKHFCHDETSRNYSGGSDENLFEV